MAQNDARDVGMLPEGWAWTTLEEICEVNPRITRAEDLTDDTPVSFVPMAAVDEISGSIVEPETRPIGEVWRGYKRFEENDVIFAKITPCMENGKAAIAHRLLNGIGLGSTEFHVLRSSEAVTPQWLYHFVRQESFRANAAAAMTGTAGQLRVPTKHMEEAPIPLAPLPEQHRIVAEIETQFTRLEAGVAALKRAQAKLRRYKASVLKAACEGRLVPTEAELARAEGRDYEPAEVLLQRILAERRAKWEAENPGKKYKEPTSPDTSDLPELPEGWVWVSFEQVLVELKNGYFGGRPRTEPPGVPILRISAVRPMSVSFGALRYLPKVDVEKISVYELMEDDLLFTRYNGNLHLVGACGLVRQVNAQVLYPDKLIRGRVVREVLLPTYAEIFFATATARKFIESRAKTTAGQYGIAGGELRRSPIAFPPVPEQDRIVAEVERRLSVVGELEKQVEAALRRAERLRQAILKHAFEGKLVPQDSEDEPASALLARIRSRRLTAQGQSRGEGTSPKVRQARLPNM